MAKVKITETVLRDAHQSLIETRMSMEEILPMLEALDKVGYYSVEAWGGATYDACLRYLDEDPWERLRTIKKHMPKTQLQMLFRGQSLLGYRHFADDVVDYFVRKSVDNGIEIIRVYDALNDPRNLATAIKSAKYCKTHVQGAIAYTTGELFTVDYLVRYAKELEALGADSICVKDKGALLTPYAAYDLVKALKSALSIPVQVHTHFTSGLADMACLKAVEAGVDMLDTAISPMAMGTSHPATEVIVAALAGTPYDTELKLDKLQAVRDEAMILRDKYLASGQLDPRAMTVDVNVLTHQIPGSMLRSIRSQLEAAGREDLIPEVLSEVPAVRKNAGMPPLVTPISQIIGAQAVNNVLSGERYGTVTKEFKGLVRGEYGKTPVAVKPAFQKEIVGDEKPITCRPADLIPEELDRFRRELPLELVEQEEDVLSYAQFGDMAISFFKRRRDDKYGIDSEHAVHEAQVHPV